ncbi:MAG: ABC transporter permease, partial [Desulfurococcaceae archaeon]
GMMSGATRFIVEETIRFGFETPLGLVLEDNSSLIQSIVYIINQTTGGRVKVYDSLIKAAIENGVGILIPKGFSENITRGDQSYRLEYMITVDRVSFTSVSSKMALVNSLSSYIERIILEIIVQETGQRPAKVDVMLSGSAIFYGKVMDGNIVSIVVSTLSFLPLLVSIVTGLNIGYSAQLVAYEKSEKAFEMLLAQPIKRRDIVIAKLIGATVATILFSLIYLAGMFIMTLGAVSGLPIDTSSLQNITGDLALPLGLNIISHIIVSLAIAIVLGLIQTGAIGIVLGSISQDERTASLLIMPFTFLYVGIAIMIMYVGLQLDVFSSVVSGLVILPLPVVYTISVITGQILYIVASLVTSLIFCIVLYILAVKLFNRDVVVLGLRISISRFRERREKGS